MSEASKAARKAAASKLKKMVSADPSGAPVDASSYTPPEPLGATSQTGMRPVSKRQFKRGGKVLGHVKGAAAHHHAGRKPRKAGGSAMPPVDRFINRDDKKANEFRDGTKHIGGMKKGGRVHKMGGGGMDPQAAGAMQDPRMVAAQRMAASNRANVPQAMLQSSPTTSKLSKGAGLKKGGMAHRSHKGGGGTPMPPEMPASIRASRAAEAAQSKMNSQHQYGLNGDIRPDRRNALPGDDITTSIGARMEDRKRGGRTSSHPDVAEDKKLIKKMVKGAALKCGGGSLSKETGTRPTGGRMARKDGGRAKGKSDIKIMINAAPHPQEGMMQPQGGPPKPAGAVPVPMPPAGGAPAGAPPMPMPIPMPMPMGGPPQGAPQMGRKAGGRVYRTAQDIDAGSASGEGRLEKSEIQKYQRHH